MKECPACRNCFGDNLNHCPTDGHLLTSSIAGDTVLDGRYQLERRLGQGGMGIVFKARHIFLKTSYAIKVILPDLVGNDPMLLTRFRQEAMVAARIGHQNIVNVTDFGVVEGKMPYLVMDFIKGKSLHDVIARMQRLDPEPALEIMYGLCAGVRAAHLQGIIHRDLKPLNVMLRDGQIVSDAVKVLDFGLAKIKSGELLGSFVGAQTTGLMGSPYYMAPEQWSDEELDARADIYSMGVMLYQMLTGDVPFKGPSLPSIMKKHLSDLPPSFITRGVSVPDPIEAVVRRTLEKKREDRMSSVDEFIHELRAAVLSTNQTRTHRLTVSRPDAQTLPYLEVTRELPIGRESIPETETLTESQRRIADEADRLAREFEEAQRRADEARQRAEEAARKRAEEEATRRRAEEEAARKLAEEEAARQRADELARKRAEEEAARKLAEEEAARVLAEEQARQRAEEEEARRRAAEEAARLAREIAEVQQRAEEARVRAEEESRKRTEEEVARRRAEEEAQRLALEVAEAKRRAEEARKRAEEESRKRAEEEQLRKIAEDQEQLKRAEELARIHAEEELARKRAADDADRLAREVVEAQIRAEEARHRAEEEARRRAEAEEARQRAEEDAHKLALQVAEAQRRAVESRQRSEEEAIKRAQLEEAQRRLDEQIRQQRQQELERQLLERAKEQEVTQVLPSTIDSQRAEQFRSGFNQKAGAYSLGAQEETILHQSQLLQPQTSWQQSQPFEVSVAPAAPKRRFTAPIIGGVVVLLILIIAGGITAFYVRERFRDRREQTPISGGTKSDVKQVEPTLPKNDHEVKIESGIFQMGRSDLSASGSKFESAQYPAHPVNVESFWMDKTEVTNEEYATFVKETGHPAPTDWIKNLPRSGKEKWPVTNVSLEDAMAFADWRSSKHQGMQYRLPTEMEWEYAARNGAEGTLYPWGNDWLADRANLDSKSLKPVGSYRQGASRLGVLDLIGNAWEWTSSEAGPYPGNRYFSIEGPKQVIIRGGAYLESSSGSEAITATARSYVPATAKDPAIGFRLVRNVR